MGDVYTVCPFRHKRILFAKEVKRRQDIGNTNQ
jgi:hypothetical protein